METQRLRLLRLVAGLLAAVVFLSVAPFSRGVSRWIGEGVLSILLRAETAAQYLVIVQARVLAVKAGHVVDHERLLNIRIRDHAGSANEASLTALRERLEALLALLENLPRHGLRLLRQSEKRVRRLLRARRTDQIVPGPDTVHSEGLCALRLVRVRIERPPDKRLAIVCSYKTPPIFGREAKTVAARR